MRETLPTLAQLPLLDKRWNERRSRFLPPDDCMNPAAYSVRPISVGDARAFVQRHHYAGSLPAARLCVGLIRDGVIVGVAVFSVPMSDSVLTKYLGTRDGCELGRFVLHDREPFNSETWFLARALRILRVEKPSLRGVVSFSDPLARHNSTTNELTKRAHFGVVYRAANAALVGRSSPRWLLVAPNGSLVSPRALSKIRNGEQGRAYAERGLVSAGVPARIDGETAPAWLGRVVPQLQRVRHPGNLAFTFAL